MQSDISTGELLFYQKDRKFFDIPAKIAIFLIVAVIVFYYFFAFTPIEGNSMENNIHDGQFCLVQRKCYNINRGDIVTIDTDDSTDQHLIIKRVIAVGGDKLIFMRTPDLIHYDLYLCKAGETHFKLLNENYIKEQMAVYVNSMHNGVYYDTPLYERYDDSLVDIDLTSTEAAKISDYIITVPQGHIFFMGDNRNVSKDSRFYGALSEDKVTAKALWVI